MVETAAPREIDVTHSCSQVLESGRVVSLNLAEKLPHGSRVSVRGSIYLVAGDGLSARRELEATSMRPPATEDPGAVVDRAGELLGKAIVAGLEGLFGSPRPRRRRGRA